MSSSQEAAALEVVAKQLSEAMRFNQRLTDSLAEELLSNRSIRAELQANLATLQNTVAEIRAITHGSAVNHPITVTLQALENRLLQMESQHAKLAQAQEVRSAQLWAILVQNSPTILAGACFVLWKILDYFFAPKQ